MKIKGAVFPEILKQNKGAQLSWWIGYLFYLSESELTNLAGLYRDERLKQKAESLKLENCEKLSKLIGLRRGGWKDASPALGWGFATCYYLCS